MSSSTPSEPRPAAARKAASEFSTSRADAPRWAMTSGFVTSSLLLQQAIRLLCLDPVRFLLDIVHDRVVLGLGQHRLQVSLVLLRIVHRLALDRVQLVRVHPDLPVELEVGDLEVPLPLRDEQVQALDELRDLLPVQLAAVLVELRLVGLRLVLALVVAPLQPPNVRPVRRGGVVRAEQVEGSGDPLIEEALHHLGWHLARLHDPQQAVVPGAQVERFLLEHRVHGARQRVKGRDGEHRQLELAVAIDELGVGEEVEPVVDELVERSEQALPFVGAALEQLRRLTPAFVPEVPAEQVRHLPTVSHLLGHHPHQGQQVVVARRVGQEIALLLDRSKLGIALINDQVQQGVADALVRDVHHRRPLALAPVVPELDVRHLLVPELRLELEVADLALGQADRVLPVAEVVDPFVEVVQLADHLALLLGTAAPMRSRASGVANNSFCCAISRSSIDASEVTSLMYTASLARRTAAAGWAAHTCASRRASPGSSASDTTRSSRPSARASVAGTMRALHTSSSAFDGPTSRGRKKLPPQSGTSPSLWNTCPIDA